MNYFPTYVVVTGGRAVAVPPHCDPSDVAYYINPGLLSDEYQVLQLEYDYTQGDEE